MGVAEAEAKMSKAKPPSTTGGASTGSASNGAVATGPNTNEIRFFKNGKDQGVAFTGIPPGAMSTWSHH